MQIFQSGGKLLKKLVIFKENAVPKTTQEGKKMHRYILQLKKYNEEWCLTLFHLKYRFI